MISRKAYYLLFILPIFILSGLIFSSHVMLADEGCTTGKSCTFINPAQSLEGYREFCKCCYNGHLENEGMTEVRCVPGPGGGSSSSGGTSPCISTGDPLVDLACQMGRTIGEGLREALIPSPQELQRREDERKRLEEEARKRAEELEKARIEEEKRRKEQFERIMKLLKNTQDGVPPLPSLILEKRKKGIDLFGSGNALGSLIYDFKQVNSIETINTESAITQLKSVAYLSNLASATKDKDTAKFFSDAAFELVTKGTMNFKIPDNEPVDVKGKAVTNSLEQTKKRWNDYLRLRKEYISAQKELIESKERLAKAEKEKRIAEEKRQAEERKLKELQDHKNSIPSSNKEEIKNYELKLKNELQALDDLKVKAVEKTGEYNTAKTNATQSEGEYKKTVKDTTDFIDSKFE
jgi:DNA repair exonuclease SbcCD ATPase subunit